ncbi:ferredoxin [Verrucomicrobiota bacterium]
MKVVIDTVKCVACGLCSEICPQVFEMESEHAGVKVYPIPLAYEEACRKAAERCLVDAIQLSD